MSLSLDSKNTPCSSLLSFEIRKKKRKPLSASHVLVQHTWVCSTNCREVLKERKKHFHLKIFVFKKEKYSESMIPFRFCWWDNFPSKKQTSVKTETCTKEVINTPQSYILAKIARQSQKSSTVLTKPSEQASSNLALVLLVCTWEYVTPDRETSDQRLVSPREKNINSQNRFIPLLQVLRDKQYRNGSCSRQHHIQTTQWWAQNKYQDCKIDLLSKEIQLWHERQIRVRKFQIRQITILKEGLFTANGGFGMPHFRTAEVQPTVISCRRQIHKMDKVCSWEQPSNTMLPVSGKQRKKSIFIRLHKGWATLLSPWLRLTQIPTLLCVPYFCVKYSHSDTVNPV